MKTINELLKTQELINKSQWKASSLITLGKAAMEARKSNMFIQANMSNALIDAAKLVKTYNASFDSKMFSNLFAQSSLKESSFLSVNKAIKKAFEQPKQATAFFQSGKAFKSITDSFINQVNISSALYNATEKNKLSGYLINYNSIESTLSTLGAQINAIGILERNEELLSKFESITQKAVITAEVLSGKKYATVEDIDNIKEFYQNTINELTEQVKKIGKSPLAIISLWVTVISILFSIYMLIQPSIQNENPDDKPATQQQIENLKKELTTHFDLAIKETTKTATVRIQCPLRVKPKTKSLILFVLKPKCQINILEVNHKWSKVIIIDPEDKMPIVGWVLKKYIY